MYRVVKASRQGRYQSEALRRIASVADSLSKIAAAQTDEEAMELFHDNVMKYRVEDKYRAIEATWQILEYAMSQYMESSDQIAKRPAVEEKLLKYFEGYFGRQPRLESDDTYVLLEPATFRDFDQLRSNFASDFHAKPSDGTMLGGSWTGHDFKIDDVTFHLSIYDGQIILEFK